MDLSKSLNLIRRYLWLLVLSTLVASLAAFYVLNKEPVTYRATTKLLVGPSLDSDSPDLNSLKIGAQLILTYSELVTTRSFLESVNNKLDQKTDIDTLDSYISTRQNAETRVLTIITRHQDPKQALAIANAVAETLIEFSPSKDNTSALLRAQVSNQFHLLEEIITNTETSIQQLEAELVALKSVPQISPEETKAVLEQQDMIIRQLGDERALLSDSLRTSATFYQMLLNTNTNQLEVIEPARMGTVVDTNLLLRVATAGISGLVLALFLIFAVEFFDDRIRYPEDFTSAAGVSMLSTIDKHDRLGGSGLERLVTFAQPKSRAANGYRTVVAKLLFSIGESIPYTFLLSSVGLQYGDDTATVTLNLAIAFAQAGSRVVVVDDQLHNPVLTKLISADDRAGLADFLGTNSTKPQLLPVKEVPGLRLLPAGLISEKGSGTTQNSTKIAKLLEEIQKEADIVLIAGSPISWFAESLTLASQVNGVILVARPMEAYRKMVNELVKNLHGMNVQLSGVIFDYNSSSSSQSIVSAVSPLISSEASLTTESDVSTPVTSEPSLTTESAESAPNVSEASRTKKSKDKSVTLISEETATD